MTNPKIFDEYATKYDDAVNASITASGESAAYFAALKARIVSSVLPSGPTPILDFGCGTGLSTRALATATNQRPIVGIDPSSDSIDEARAATAPGPTQFLTLEGKRLPFQDQSFGAVSAACVFHHIPREEQQHWVGELARVLTPGGLLFIFEHNPFNPLTRRAVKLCPFDEGVELLRPAYTAKLARGANLEVNRTSFYFFFPNFLSFLRPVEPFIGRCPLGAQYYVLAQRR